MLFYRQADLHDIPALHIIRTAVKENVLSDPGLVTEKDYEEYLGKRGKGWVCESGEAIAGFAIVDLLEHNVWALFVHPDHEKKGIGSKLHDLMIHWYFQQTSDTLWLGTSPKTRAESFYRHKGWEDKGMHKKEIRFEYSYEKWLRQSNLKP